MKAPRPKESDLHKAVVSLLRKAAPHGVIFFHIPNGEKRSAITGARLKKLGVRPGVADLGFVMAGGRAAFLELKRPGGRLSPDQRLFAAECDLAGAFYAVVDNIDAAVAVLKEWRILNNAILPAAAGREGRGATGAGRRRAPTTNTRVSGVSA